MAMLGCRVRSSSSGSNLRQRSKRKEFSEKPSHSRAPAALRDMCSTPGAGEHGVCAVCVLSHCVELRGRDVLAKLRTMVNAPRLRSILLAHVDKMHARATTHGHGTMCRRTHRRMGTGGVRCKGREGSVA
eukprot:5191446-Prymnesium_polylepis.4